MPAGPNEGHTGPPVGEQRAISDWKADRLPRRVYPSEKALAYYQRCLAFLQTKFLELIAFCLDKSSRPEVLGRLYPLERGSLWCKIKGVSSCRKRQEDTPFGVGFDKTDGIAFRPVSHIILYKTHRTNHISRAFAGHFKHFVYPPGDFHACLGLNSSHAAGAWGLAWYSKNTMVPLTVTGPCASPRFRLTLSSIQR